MRVLQVVNVRWFNATSWYALYLGRLLRDAGHEVLVLTLENTETHEQAKKWGLNTRVMDLNARNPLKIVPLYFEIKKLVNTFSPDIINCHRGEAFVLFGLLKKKSNGFRLVRTRGDQRPPRKNAVNKWLYGSAADAVVAPNSVMARYIQENLGVPKDKIHLILGGVDRKFFSFDPKGRHTIKVCLGTACYVKGIKEVISRIENEFQLEEGGTSPDRRFSLEAVRCLGACGLAPVMVVGEDTYGDVKADTVIRKLEEYE